MKNILHKKIWSTGAVQIHVDPPLIPLIKIKNDMKLGKYFVKIKLRRDPTLEQLHLYKFKLALFGNRKPESSCCSCETSKLCSRIWERLLLEKIDSIFIRYYMMKRYLSLILCVIRWRVQPQHI